MVANVTASATYCGNWVSVGTTTIRLIALLRINASSATKPKTVSKQPQAKFGSSEADQSAQEPDSSAAPESLDQEHSINGEMRGPVGIRVLHRDE